MAEAVVSAVLEKLSAVIERKIPQFVGLDREFKRLRDSLETIHYFVADAENRQMSEAAVGVWLDRLKGVSYDMEDMLDEWNTAILKSQFERVDESALLPRKKKVCCYFLPAASCFGFNHIVVHHDIALKIKEINLQINEIARRMEMYNFNHTETRSLEIPVREESISLVDETEVEVCGREEEKFTIISKLLSESSENHEGPRVISIVGIGGIGKTTLAQLVYNDYKVRNHFDKIIWVCVSDSFDEFVIAKSIIEALEGTVPNFGEFQSLLQHISKCIVGKKFFLVLDDVWNENYIKWEPFSRCLMNGLHGSRILITTRMETVALMMGSTDVIKVLPWSLYEAWSLFCRLVFSGRYPEKCEEFEDIGKELVYKCKGLPLAVKAIGGILRSKRTISDWQRILESELWDVQSALLVPLLLSYNDLPSNAKRCFSYCAIFPKDFQIEKDKLIKLWMAQGYLGMGEREEMEISGQMYFDLLVTRYFFQDFKKDGKGNIVSCKMHDIVSDFVQYLSRKEIVYMEVNDGLLETNIIDELRHIMLALNKEVSSFPVYLSNAKKVRSLLVQYDVSNCSSVSKVLPLLFKHLTSLRALDLSGQLWCENVVIKIPREIGELILLRYLNLSLLKINELPEELCELCNLQTLELNWCPNLRKLPLGMGKLIKLRHLVNVETSLTYMPRGIEKLTGLRTLSEFIVSGEDDDRKACTLACLKNLNHLAGSLHIKNLGTVKGFWEIVEAELENKIEVTRLYLNFAEAEEFSIDKGGESKVSKESSEVEEAAFRMPPNLEFLEIRDYKGNSRFLDCIMSLNKLRTLNLHSCMNLDHLPPLRRLPFLESLSISSVRSARVVNELLGISCHGALSSSAAISFPELKSLKFVNVEEWEDWDCGTIMPCLRFLSLVYCPKLKALPLHILRSGTLEELTINWCPILEERYNKTGEWHNISRIPNIVIDFEYVQRGRH